MTEVQPDHSEHSEQPHTGRAKFWQVYVGLLVALILCLAVGVAGMLATADQSKPPEYHRTAQCPTEDSCAWIPVGPFKWDWVPVIP